MTILKITLEIISINYNQTTSYYHNLCLISISIHLYQSKMSFGSQQPHSIYMHSQVSPTKIGSSNIKQNGGLFHRDQCRTLAKNIIECYDGNNDGICETIEVGKWLVDCYRAMNKNFQPTATDIASYVQIVDRNKNGKISVDDLESFILKYFLLQNQQ